MTFIEQKKKSRFQIQPNLVKQGGVISRNVMDGLLIFSIEICDRFFA